jgi:hypothetical protein
MGGSPVDLLTERLKYGVNHGSTFRKDKGWRFICEFTKNLDTSSDTPIQAICFMINVEISISSTQIKKID